MKSLDNIHTIRLLKNYLFRDKRPELVKVDSRLVQVGVVRVHVEVPHSHLQDGKFIMGEKERTRPFRSNQDGICRS